MKVKKVKKASWSKLKIRLLIDQFLFIGDMLLLVVDIMIRSGKKIGKKMS